MPRRGLRCEFLVTPLQAWGTCHTSVRPGRSPQTHFLFRRLQFASMPVCRCLLFWRPQPGTGRSPAIRDSLFPACLSGVSPSQGPGTHP